MIQGHRYHIRHILSQAGCITFEQLSIRASCSNRHLRRVLAALEREYVIVRRSGYVIYTEPQSIHH